MSQENVEIVRQGADAFNRRDIAAILRDFDHDAEWVEDQRYPGAETFSGPSGVERSIRKWWDAWGEIAMEIDETIRHGRPRGSGRSRAGTWPRQRRHGRGTFRRCVRVRGQQGHSRPDPREPRRGG